jgi:antitoxin VapB
VSARAKLFKNGRSQAVRLPAQFRFEGEEVEVREGPRPGEVILAPVSQSPQSWEELFAFIDSLNIAPEEWDAFKDVRDKSPPRPEPFGGE